MENLKQSSVVQWMQKDLLAADFRWSVFISAISSYRHDTVVRPFPPKYTTRIDINNVIKHHERLVKICADVPNLHRFLSQHSTVNEEQLDVLHWLLEPRTFSLRSCPKDIFSEIEVLTGQVGAAPVPNFIFEVEYNQSLQERFSDVRGSRDLLYGFHGSRVENFHSILHHGLVQHMNKNALFGEGTYLSAELSITLPYAPTGSGWTESILGDKLSCIAVCEIINDVSSVKCVVKDADNNVEKKRAVVKDSLGGNVPEKYFVVRNDEMLRVKYVLVYATKTLRKKSNSPSRWTWVSDHKFAVTMAFYVFVLCLIGLGSSPAFKNFMRKYYLR